jgi:toxin-antitoxin system PIN domain toxin
VIAVDTNVLVHAHRCEPREHAHAAALLRRLCEGAQQWAIPWPCIYEFFSVVTHPKIWKAAASTPTQAWLQLEAWCASPSLSLLSETPDFSEILGPLLQRARVRGPIVHDARVAALCISHGVTTLWTCDRDFALFPELKTENPLGPEFQGT